MYGEQFRANRENQWWTRKGYEKAKTDNKLDPQIAAVWSNYVKFYGRDEALCRHGIIEPDERSKGNGESTEGRLWEIVYG